MKRRLRQRPRLQLAVPKGARDEVAALPLKAMGRFVHEAVAVDPGTGIVYETAAPAREPVGRRCRAADGLRSVSCSALTGKTTARRLHGGPPGGRDCERPENVRRHALRIAGRRARRARVATARIDGKPKM